MPVRPRFYYLTILLFYYFIILLILRELGSLHLENPPAPVRLRFYYFTILLFYGKSGVCISKAHLCRLDPEITALLISREIQRKFLPLSLLLIGFPPRARQFASRKPTCAGPTQILLFYDFTILLFFYFSILLFYYFTILLFYGKSGACISKTHLCRLDPEITAFLISRKIQRKFLPLSLLLIGFPPRAQQFASRKPTCAGPTQILLFYYFTILLILREVGSLHLENSPVPVGPRIYRFTEKIPPSLFTFNRISSTGSAVCISKTHLRRSDPDFTILLFC